MANCLYCQAPAGTASTNSEMDSGNFNRNNLQAYLYGLNRLSTEARTNYEQKEREFLTTPLAESDEQALYDTIFSLACPLKKNSNFLDYAFVSCFELPFIRIVIKTLTDVLKRKIYYKLYPTFP